MNVEKSANKGMEMDFEKLALIKTTHASVHGGFAAVNRGADYVKHLVPSLRARTRYLTGHRKPHNQAELACTAPGAGQHRD